MKNLCPFACALLMSALSWLAGNAHAQGSLTPPGGPGPMMKTLQQVEPRVDVLTLPTNAVARFLISAPGSYYLSTNLLTTNLHAIRVEASDVTIDLNGFSLIKQFAPAANGIDVGAGYENLTVRNGSIRGFNYGIKADLASGCFFDELAVSQCSQGGIIGYAGAMVRNCRIVTGSGGKSILVGVAGMVENCSVRQSSGTSAIEADTDSVVKNCRVSQFTGQYGILAGQNSLVDGCVVSSSSVNYGITSSAGGIVTRSIAQYCYGSGAVGIYASGANIISECVSKGNLTDGIYVNSGARVEGNNLHQNTGSGVNVAGNDCRIEGNHANGNATGFTVNGTGSLVVRNSGRANTPGGNFVIVAGNAVGATNNASQVTTNQMPNANVGF